MLSGIKITVLNGEISSGKSDRLTSDEVLKLKNDINQIVKDIPSTSLSTMVRSWHSSRLENTGNWTSLGNDSFLVDSSLIDREQILEPGRITKNLQKLEIYVSGVQIYLDGISHKNGKHDVEIVLSYDIELTFRLGKALLMDTKVESKKIIRSLEETMFYKLPSMDKCMLSEQHKQGIELN